MKSALLGGLSPTRFLAEYWQRKPLLVRGAVPEAVTVLTPEALLELAKGDDIESRQVYRTAHDWRLVHGPLTARQLARGGPWTALVSGTNLVSAAADRLLRRFDFVPYARLDDLMVSFATDGGGVGPHFDSYDVFLIQGLGRRRWRISNQADLSLIDGAPLRILRNFVPTDEWVLEPGDMLYLPPQYAHEGIAEGPCMTYSVGFRAPTAQELADAFLAHLQESLQLEGRYADAGIALQDNAARIGDDVIERVAAMLRGIRWSRSDVATFLGQYLSEPKPHIFFAPPDEPMTQAAFAREVSSAGFRLDLRTQLLFRGASFFLNGESIRVPAEVRPALRRLAHRRALSAKHVNPAVTEALYGWYCDGFGWPGASHDGKAS